MVRVSTTSRVPRSCIGSASEFGMRSNRRGHEVLQSISFEHRVWHLVFFTPLLSRTCRMALRCSKVQASHWHTHVLAHEEAPVYSKRLAPQDPIRVGGHRKK